MGVWIKKIKSNLMSGILITDLVNKINNYILYIFNNFPEIQNIASCNHYLHQKITYMYIQLQTFTLTYIEKQKKHVIYSCQR